MVERRKLKLIEYQKTRNSVVKKVAVPSPSDLLGAEVKKPTKEIAHLINVTVASKHDSDMSTIRQVQ